MSYYYAHERGDCCRNDGINLSTVNAKANAGLITGIIGDVLGLLAVGDRGGAIQRIISGGCASNAAEAEAILAQIKAQSEIAQLKGQQYTDKTVQELFNKQYAENKELSNFLCAERNRITALEGRIETDKAQGEVAMLKQQIDNMKAFHEYEMRIEKRLDHLEASVPLVQERCMGAICAEREKRECADNAIVGYVNTTFYPIQVADVTVGTTNTARTLYNPLPCQCGCGPRQ